MHTASDFQIPSWQPGIKDPLCALDFGLSRWDDPTGRPTQASMENLLRKAAFKALAEQPSRASKLQ